MMPLLEQHNKMLHRLLEIDIWAWFAFLAPFFIFFQKYVYSDWNFLAFLLVLMFLDLVTGVVKAWKKGKFITSTGFRDTVIKVFQYGIFLIVIHVLISFQINGETVALLNYADEAGYTFLIVIEAKSIFENLQSINPKLDLTIIIEKLKAVSSKKKD